MRFRWGSSFRAIYLFAVFAALGAAVGLILQPRLSAPIHAALFGVAVAVLGLASTKLSGINEGFGKVLERAEALEPTARRDIFEYVGKRRAEVYAAWRVSVLGGAVAAFAVSSVAVGPISNSLTTLQQGAIFVAAYAAIAGAFPGFLRLSKYAAQIDLLRQQVIEMLDEQKRRAEWLTVLSQNPPVAAVSGR